MGYEDAMAALADPTRRALVEALRGGAMPVCDLARHVPVSRPAVSQHLRVLGAAGLVVATPDGARRLYAISPHGLAELRRWLDTLWEDALRDMERAAVTHGPTPSERKTT